jgi:hypothetical protein
MTEEMAVLVDGRRNGETTIVANETVLTVIDIIGDEKKPGRLICAIDYSSYRYCTTKNSSAYLILH